MSLSEIVEAAADRLMKGWCQGQSQDSRGRVCMFGALNAILENKYQYHWSSTFDAQKQMGLFEERNQVINLLNRSIVARHPEVLQFDTQTVIEYVKKPMVWLDEDTAVSFTTGPVAYDTVQTVKHGLSPIPAFNDMIAKTKEECYDEFMVVAKQLRDEGK